MVAEACWIRNIANYQPEGAVGDILPSTMHLYILQETAKANGELELYRLVLYLQGYAEEYTNDLDMTVLRLYEQF
ncbi:hypothetical protein FPOAC2_02974 [Fusarium poae]|jgi:hypothetical protein